MARKDSKPVSKEKKSDDLSSRLRQAEEKLAKLRVDKNAGKLKNTSAVNQSRREIAKIKTILRQKELNL